MKNCGPIDLSHSYNGSFYGHYYLVGFEAIMDSSNDNDVTVIFKFEFGVIRRRFNIFARAPSKFILNTIF